MPILCLTVLIWVTVATVTHACAPHGVSQPWTKTTNVNNHHHHHTVENIYFDNRTIFNKIVEIEKRIDKIEEMEKMIPLEPEKPKNPLVVKPPVDPGNPIIPPVEPPKKTDEVTVPEKEEEPEPEPDKKKNCLSCPSKPPVLEDCENCVSVITSAPFEYYACKAVEIKCADGAKKLKISESNTRFIVENKFMSECRKGDWVLTAAHQEHKIDTISCLTM